MVVSMVLGVIFYPPLVMIDGVVGGWTSPALLSVMLFISCCGVDFTKMKIGKLHITLLALQIIFSLVVYFATAPLDRDVAGGLLICAMTPVAITSVVISKFLGAKVDNLIAFSLLSNVVSAIYLPFVLSMMGEGTASTWQILQMVMPVIIVPMVVSQIMRAISIKVGVWISGRDNLSLGLWLLLILFIFARTTNYFVTSYGSIEPMQLTLLLVGSLVICIAQFVVGKGVGLRLGDKVAGSQSLGQKNTILAVWLASSFISPIAALAPTAYIIWQNVVNTYKIYRHDTSKERD